MALYITTKEIQQLPEEVSMVWERYGNQGIRQYLNRFHSLLSFCKNLTIILYASTTIALIANMLRPHNITL